MLKHLFVLVLFAMAFQIEASVNKDFKTRIEWVEDLKALMLDLEKNNPEVLTTEAGRNFLERFSFFKEAIASGNYDCFFAGWPSKLVSSGGKKLCQSPSRGNSEYDNGSCKQGQMQCQPLLFGKDLCVSFSTSKEKQLAFSTCENKFRAKGNYEFLKTLSSEEKTALKEISALAENICETGSVGVQKSKPVCKSILAKVKTAMDAIERAPAGEDDIDENENPEKQNPDEKEPEESDPEDKNTTVNTEVNTLPKVDPAPEKEVVDVSPKPGEVNPPVMPNSPKTTDEECEVPVVVDKQIEKNAEDIVKVVNNDTDKLYEEIKKEFLASPHCKPENVFNDPADRLSPVLFSHVIEEMRFILDKNKTREQKVEHLKSLGEKFLLSKETISYGEELIKNYPETNEGRFEAMARLRGVILQEMAKIAAKTPGYQSDIINEGLAQRGVFTYDKDGNPECPFVDIDAFRSALAGRDEVLKSGNKSLIKNEDLLTIVDYSAPSNQRRMYVIDLKTKKVLHNTWVAHGGGKDRSQEQGKEDPKTGFYGSRPETSNDNGSNLSSEGFYIAKAAGHGATYLNNVILKGIDKDNTNMESRGIVVHGWRTPNHAFTDKTWEFSETKNPTRIPGRDIYKEFMSVDFKNTKQDLFDISTDIMSAAAARPYMDATEGCLGVPDTKMGHVDRKGRNMSQLELLRDDLPGTLMFNYNGPNTKSKYLK